MLKPFFSFLAVLGLLAMNLGTFFPSSASSSTLRTITVDDRVTGTGDNQFNYRGTWSNNSVGGYYNSTHSWSNTAGGSVTMTFSGTQFRLYGGLGSNGGIATVSIDGGPAYEVDFYASSDQGDAVLWVSGILPNGHHTFTLAVAGIRNGASSGTYVVLDRVDIIDAKTVALDDRVTGGGYNQFNYSGTWAKDGARDYYGNTHSYSTTVDSAVTIFFNGAGIDFYGGVGAAGGIGAASIDGGPEQKVDFYAAADAGNRLLWQSGPLRPGTHTFSLRVTGEKNTNSAGTRIATDRVDVISSAVTTPIPSTTAGAGTGWTKFARNPVLGKNYGTAFDTSMLHENGVYKMWFSWRNANAIAYVQSVDGISWTKPRSVLSGIPDTWEQEINRPSVIYNSRLGMYQMWYTGQNGISKIGYATSTDGITWTRSARNPVMRAGNAWEKNTVLNPSVLWNSRSNVYQMWYAAGFDYEPKAIGYATSADGVTWVKSDRNPVLTANPAKIWEKDRVSGASVFQQSDGYYYMFYIGYTNIDRSAIGIARSRDGVTWQRMPTNPIVGPVRGTWECDADYKPSVLWEDVSQSWKLWYNGRCGAPEQQGLALHRGSSLGF
ncbi:hypothetical protein N5079_13115 [Planotetraspora sp. A-T 1434]|uniref:glycoside hydrolase family 130 protein n=1 Tax=Planotetraspora sp. A-T 1434 TaxID=2979219 RepID=UPI0021C1ED4B|nr:hypothetical protein [Planotetraspora sp. A-T 1434]MCT9931158.1 hypothetical protein [Planotetraspora sp. A-T 1434]